MSEIVLTKNAASVEADFDMSADCPTLTIGLTSHDAPLFGAFILHVWATLPDAEMYCGAFLIGTAPPLGKSRVIGFACYPGAEAFRLKLERSTGAPPEASARLILARHHKTITPGLTANGSLAGVFSF